MSSSVSKNNSTAASKILSPPATAAKELTIALQIVPYSFADDHDGLHGRLGAPKLCMWGMRTCASEATASWSDFTWIIFRQASTSPKIVFQVISTVVELPGKLSPAENVHPGGM